MTKPDKKVLKTLKTELRRLDSALSVLIEEHSTIYNNTSSRVFQSIGRCEMLCDRLGKVNLKHCVANLASSLYNMYDGINYDAAIEDLKLLKETIEHERSN